MLFEDYFKTHIGKKVTVCGIGVSNLPLVRILRERGVFVDARDRKTAEELGESARELEGLGVRLICGPDYLKGIDADIIYRSPGMRPDLPEFIEAVKSGAKLTSEMEAFFEVCPCRTVGITGSDGKTTTSTAIAKILEKAGYRIWLGGNIGTPLLDRVPEMRPEDIAVLELSSFQLMTLTKSPDIAVVTNVAPNHLDIHKDMEEYVEAKKNIFRYQSRSGVVVLNYDNDVTRGYVPYANGTVRIFTKHPDTLPCTTGKDSSVGHAVYLNGDSVLLKSNGKTEELLKVSDILLIGMHNVENYMAAIAAVCGLAPGEAVAEVARTFTGVEHRTELVRELNRVRYYNDSIASSPTRTIAGLLAFPQKVILIAGGYDKHIPYEPLAEVIPDHVKTLILMGATKDKIRTAVEKLKEEGAADIPPIFEADSLEEAVATARAEAREGDIVFFSPASASFDMFRNFEERGNKFKALVNDLT